MSVMNKRRPVDADTNADLMFFEELAPIVAGRSFCSTFVFLNFDIFVSLSLSLSAPAGAPNVSLRRGR
jgi:hypothetical protein